MKIFSQIIVNYLKPVYEKLRDRNFFESFKLMAVEQKINNVLKKTLNISSLDHDHKDDLNKTHKLHEL